MLSAERGSTELGLAIVDRQYGLTPAKALSSPQLSLLNAAAPGDTAEALGNLLHFTSHQFNVVRNLTDVQLMLLSNDLVERYWDWKFDEFVYLCKEAIAGRWGKAYDRIDPPTVHEWCQAYAAIRTDLLADEAERASKQHKVAELATGPPRFANEQQVKRYLEGLSDEKLMQGMQYYTNHPEQPQAAIKLELAAQVLLDRKFTSALKQAVGVKDDSDFTSAEEVTEADYKKFRAAWVAQRARAAEDANPQTEAAA